MGYLGLVFVIEDDFHAEPLGRKFGTLAEAKTVLRACASAPWDEAPNQAPCTSWRTCGRRWEIREYDDSVTPWRLLRRGAELHVSAAGVEWISEIPGPGS